MQKQTHLRSRTVLVVVARTPPAPHARRPPRTLSSLLLEEEALGRLVRVRVRASGQGSGEGWGPGEGLGVGLGVRARSATRAPSPRRRPWRRPASCSAGSRCPCRPTRPWYPGAAGFAANRGASRWVGGGWVWGGCSVVLGGLGVGWEWAGRIAWAWRAAGSGFAAWGCGHAGGGWGCGPRLRTRCGQRLRARCGLRAAGCGLRAARGRGGCGLHAGAVAAGGTRARWLRRTK